MLTTVQWTAFGIMLGYVADLALYKVPDTAAATGLNWRLMMASAMLPAVVVCCFVFLCPESPRWYLSKGRHAAAYHAMCQLRYNKVQAARDLFYMAELLKAEEGMKIGQSKIMEIITVPRNRRAMIASEIVMFMQQVGFLSPKVAKEKLTFNSSVESTSSLITRPRSSATAVSPRYRRLLHPWDSAL